MCRYTGNRRGKQEKERDGGMNILRNIKEKTHGMTGRERAGYILTYYWYHLLGIGGAVGLLVFLIVHFAFPDPPPVFSCAIVNQEIDYERDEVLAADFARAAELERASIVIDSNYHISFTEERSAENESAFDKLFFKWAGQELDAVIMSEDFLRYCISVGGEFYSAQEIENGSTNTEIAWSQVENMWVIPVWETALRDYLDKTEEELKEENILLAFPREGKNLETCRKFVTFIGG